MYKRNILFFIVVCLLFCFIFYASAEDKTIVFGGKGGWSQLSEFSGLSKGTGRYGYQSIELSTNSRQVTSDTDLLVDFEQQQPFDSTGNYVVVSNNLEHTTAAVMGHGAGLSLGKSQGLKLFGKRDTLFGSQGFTGSFTVEFWLCPSVADNGEIIFSWKSSRTEQSAVQYQMITASFYKNHLEWDFTNVFSGYVEKNGNVSLISNRSIIPGKWAHHVISFDQNTGLLIYRIDEQTEALCYVTTTGHERGGSVCPAYFGVAAALSFCAEYTGCIDDIRIRRSALSETESVDDGQSLYSVKYDHYRKTGGHFETEPIKTLPGSILKSVNIQGSVPDQTSVCLFVRGGENSLNWTDTYPAWIRITPGKQISGVGGSVFQIAGDLYPDGNGTVSPSITQIDFTYQEKSLPLAPFHINAVPGDSQVTLSWTPSVDDSVDGYFVYYGERPGEYLGQKAEQGSSPIDAGNTTSLMLSGLQNGTIYYFTIVAYSNTVKKIRGYFSTEVNARPLCKTENTGK